MLKQLLMLAQTTVGPAERLFAAKDFLSRQFDFKQMIVVIFISAIFGAFIMLIISSYLNQKKKMRR